MLSHMASHLFEMFIFKFLSAQVLFSPNSIYFKIRCNSQLSNMVDIIFFIDTSKTMENILQFFIE